MRRIRESQKDGYNRPTLSAEQRRVVDARIKVYSILAELRLPLFDRPDFERMVERVLSHPYAADALWFEFNVAS